MIDMHPTDVLRELTKIVDALDATSKYLSLQNEANAALHMNGKILYSPLTTAVLSAHESAVMLLDNFQEDE